MIEQPGVGCQVGAWRAADRLLVHLHQPLDAVEAGSDTPGTVLLGFVFKALFVSLGLLPGMTEVGADQLQQSLADQARLARTGNAGDRGEAAHWKAGAEVVEVVAGNAFQHQPVVWLAWRARMALLLGEQVGGSARGFDLCQAGWRATVENLPTMLAGSGADVHQPVGAAHGVQVMLHHIHRVAGLLEPLQGIEQRFAVGRVQAGGRLVEDVDHAKQLRVELGGQAQALQLAERQRRRAAFQCQVTQAQVDQGVDTFQQFMSDALCGQALFQGQVVVVLLQVARRCNLAEHLGQCLQRQPRQLTDVAAGEGHLQRRTLESLALAQRARAGAHVLRHALAHLCALRVHEGMQHVAPGTTEGALVARFELALERSAGLCRCQAGVHRYRRRLLGIENPVALCLWQVAPGDVDVIAQGHQDVAQVLPLPGHRPRRHGALADSQRRVGDHGRLGHLIYTPQPMALGAGALRGIGRKVLGVQHRLPGRVAAGAGVEHADRAGQGGDAAHRRARAGRAALLLQGHGRGQAFDGIDIRHADLVDQAPGIGGDRFEVAALGLGVEGGEGQRRLARAGHPGEHHQGVAGDVDVDVLEVVLAGATDADEAGGSVQHGAVLGSEERSR